MNEVYDVSFIRHGIEVPVERIINMSVGQKALLKTEREEIRVDLNGKKGLVIERREI